MRTIPRAAWAVTVVGASLALGCADRVDLARPRDAGARDASDGPSGVDPFDDVPVRTPPDEPREDRCDGLDNDGDGRVDEGWRYVIEPYELALPPPYVLGGGWRPHQALAATLRDGYGLALWREGFLQSDGRMPFVVVSPNTPVGFEEHDFIWRVPYAYRDASQPAERATVVPAGEGFLVAWSPFAQTCQSRCVMALARVERDGGVSSPDAVDGGTVTEIPFERRHTSGLVAVDGGALFVTTSDDGTSDLRTVSPDGRVGTPVPFSFGVPVREIGQVRGVALRADTLAWVFERRDSVGSVRLQVVLTDTRGVRTRAPFDLTPSGRIPAHVGQSVYAAEASLVVVFAVDARGFFLARWTEGRPVEVASLGPNLAPVTTAYAAGTLFVCQARSNVLRVRRFSLRGELLDETGGFQGAWHTCALAANEGVALAVLGAGNGSSPGGRVDLVRCPER